MTDIITTTVTPDFEKEELKDVQLVQILNAAAGNKPSTKETLESDLMRQTNIDLSECLELIEAVVTGDIPELRDALADKRVTLNGFATYLPFSLSDDFDATMEGLFTRFDSTIENAKLTQEKYAKLGVPTTISATDVYDKEGVSISGLYYANVVAEDTKGENGEFFPKGKFVKSVNFRTPSFDNAELEINTSVFKVYDRWQVIRKHLKHFIDHMDDKCALREG